jgi:hypothetical protein
VASADGKVMYRNNNAAAMSGTISWPTNEAEPGSLPGVAA